MGAVKLVTQSGSITLEGEDTAGASTVVIPKAGVVSPDSLRTELNASGTAPIYACRAWVNFNGTGTVAIRASGNVSSITDNGTGKYTVNFTTAMEDADFTMTGSAAQDDVLTRSIRGISPHVYTTTSVQVTTATGSTSPSDMEFCNLAIFR